MIHAWKRLEKFDDTKTKIEIYLNFTVNKDVIYDYMHDMGYRKQSDRKWVRRYNNKTNLDQSVLDCKTFNDVTNEYLEELSDDQKIIVDMKIENHTQEAIGNRLGKSRSWVCAELKKIKNTLENYNGNTD